jgi:hypothetical protein
VPAKLRCFRSEYGHGRDKRGVDLISDVLPFGARWYGEPTGISNALRYATVSQAKPLNLFCYIRQPCEVP